MSTWILLALGSALFLGGYEVSRKSALVENSPLTVLLCASLGGWCSLALSLFLFGGPEPPLQIFGMEASRLEFELRTLSAQQHLQVLFKAALVTASWELAYLAVKHLPITVAAPLRAISPALTVLGALVIFNESPNSRQWWGILIIFLGYSLFAWLGKAEGISFTKSKWIWILLAGTGIGSVSGLYDKYLLQHEAFHPTTMQFWFVSYAVLLQAVAVIVLWYPDRARRLEFRMAWSAPFAGSLLVLADQFYFRALADPAALVSVVSLLRRSSVLVSFGVGSFLFKEKFLLKKSAALLLIMLGLARLVYS